MKNGKYGFHIGHQARPWWQVDLEAETAIDRIVVFNRLDYAPGLPNADNLQILASVDGQNWKLIHDNQGRHFGGVQGAPPLKATFKPGAIRARYVRLQLPGETPVYFHLDEVEIYGAGSNATNLALHRPADQSSLSPWSIAKPSGGEIESRYPLLETLARGRRLAADLKPAGLATDPFERKLTELENKFKNLPTIHSSDQSRALYFEVRRLIRQWAFRNPLLDFNRLLFVKRFTQETYPDICLNHMPWVSRPGGDLCILNSKSEGQNLFAALGDLNPAGLNNAEVELKHLLNGALGPGHVHGMDLWWDADRVVFGYAQTRADQPPEGWLDRTRSYQLRRDEEPIHLYELGIDGRHLRQLTSGEWSDLDPTYLPSGEIAFVSERCGTSLQCNEYDKDETSCNLYVMDASGGNIRRLSVNKDGDYLPHCLDNGWIGYTRWEYHERSWAYIQSIWVVRPDGTGADAIFKQHFVDPWALEDARSIPGSSKLVAIAAGHHTLAAGPVVVVNHAMGINEPRGIGIVTPGVFPPEGGMDGKPVPEGGVVDCGGYYSTPWPLSENYFLAAYTYGKERDPAGYALYLIDVFGNKELVFRDPEISCFVPIPLRPRPRPLVVTDIMEATASSATCLVTDASFGMDGVDPSRIRYLRIAEPIGWPYDNEAGGQRYGEDHRYGGPDADRKNLLSWTPIRILGDVPVEPDGSAYFQVPADTAVYFQLLDEQRMELRRMRSFISFQPGEARSCSGCHESRNIAPISLRPALAAQRSPSVPEPPPWGDRPISFLRDIQPVLDRNCARCHSGLDPKGGLDFSGGLTSHDLDIPGYGYNRAYETILKQRLVSLSQVRAQDASITPPLAYGAHRSPMIAALGQQPHDREVQLSETDHLRLVMWMDANAPYHDRFVNKREVPTAYDLAADQELARQILAIHENRCGSCHDLSRISRLDWINLREPAASLFLTAPLARDAGGTSQCLEASYVFASDPHYQQVRSLVERAVLKAWENPRRDLRSFEAPQRLQGLGGQNASFPPRSH